MDLHMHIRIWNLISKQSHESANKHWLHMKQTLIHELYVCDAVNLILCKNTFSIKRVRPESKCMKRSATTRSDIRMRPRLRHTEYINTILDTLKLLF